MLEFPPPWSQKYIVTKFVLPPRISCDLNVRWKKLPVLPTDGTNPLSTNRAIYSNITYIYVRTLLHGSRTDDF